MARLLVEVEDPLARQTDGVVPPLIIGSFVEANIEGREISNVVRLNRNYIHKNDTVWVMRDDKLDIRTVNVLLQDREFAYIDEGLEAGDKVVITRLSTVAEGARLRVKEEEGTEDETDEEKVDHAGSDI